MTLSNATTICRDLGITLRKTDGEYRINYRGSSDEATAYYTDDIMDAVETAAAMATEMKKATAHRFSFRGVDFRDVVEVIGERGSTSHVVVDIHGARLHINSYPGEDMHQRLTSLLAFARRTV